jgi:preprotein translocase subunit SecY
MRCQYGGPRDYGLNELVLVILSCGNDVSGNAFIIFMGNRTEKIPGTVCKACLGRKIYGGSYSPAVTINTAGVIPRSLPHRLLCFPPLSQTIRPYLYEDICGVTYTGTFLHELLYIGFIIFFLFFYTAIVFNPDNVRI